VIDSLIRQGINARHACLVLGVSESGYYAWKGRPGPPRTLRRIWLAGEIADVHKASAGTYGYMRVTAELRHGREILVGHNTVGQIMREIGLKGLPTRRLPKGARMAQVTSLDLVRREFRRDGPNQLWMTDITEHPTREGKVYCCVVLDLFTRKVVGWAIDRRCETALVNDALAMANDSRRSGTSTIIHSDHGTQGEFNRPSQHLDHGGVKWRRCESVNVKSSSIEDRFHRRVVRRWPGAKIESSSGWRSPTERRPKTLASRPVCLDQWDSAGSATLEG
jgi:transposase InsO family protein